MTDLEKGWFAGIIDGEGSIVLERRSGMIKWRHPAIIVTSTDHEILSKCKEIVNSGAISLKREVYSNAKTSWSWRMIGGKRVIEVLREIEPHLICPKKKKRAQYLISNYSNNTIAGGNYTDVEKETKRQFEENFYLL